MIRVYALIFLFITKNILFLAKTFTNKCTNGIILIVENKGVDDMIFNLKLVKVDTDYCDI